MTENTPHPVQHPLPAGVHDTFTYPCNDCGGPVSVVSSTRQPHACNTISDEAVEAAANAISEVSGMRFDGFWTRVEDLEPEDREHALREAKAALEAAFPHLAFTWTEWGVRRDQDSAIYSEAAARETVIRQRKRKMKSFLIKRQVGPWELADQP